MRTLLLFGLVFLGCAHEGAVPYAEQRSAELRAEYPPGKTTRAEVLSRMGHAPEVSLARPSTGWTQPFVLDVEQRTGALVARAEKFVGPATTSAGFLTLSHVWYFYDRADVLVDVVFERMSD